MNNIIQHMEEFLRYFSQIFIIILELMGGFMLVFGCIYVFYNFFSPRAKDFTTKLRIKLSRFTSLALEFFLAAEILKTIYIREFSELYIISAIIVLRILMTFVVHWEMNLDLKDLRKNIKKRHSKPD